MMSVANYDPRLAVDGHLIDVFDTEIFYCMADLNLRSTSKWIKRSDLDVRCH